MLSILRRLLRRDHALIARLGRKIAGGQRLVAVDVGAAEGIPPHWQAIDGVATIYQIEPRAEACRALEAANAVSPHRGLYKVLCAAVGRADEDRTLHVSNVPTGTSLYAPDFGAIRDIGEYVDPAYFEPLTEASIRTRRLETLLGEVGENQVDLVKLDIQGAEGEALIGLGKTHLDNVLAVEAEIGMHSLYPEAMRFPDISDLLSRSGLDLFDVRVARVLRPFEGRHGGYQEEVFSVYSRSPTISARLWEFDAVYFRRKSDILARGDAAILRRMMLAYMTYNFFSEAYDLVIEGTTAGLFSADEAAALKAAVVGSHRARLYRPWLGNTPAWARFRSIANIMTMKGAPRWCQYMYQDYPNG